MSTKRDSLAEKIDKLRPSFLGPTKIQENTAANNDGNYAIAVADDDNYIAAKNCNNNSNAVERLSQ